MSWSTHHSIVTAVAITYRASDSSWVWLREQPVGRRRVDLMLFNTTTGERVAVEAKAQFGDLFAELRNPDKTEESTAFAHHAYIATASSLKHLATRFPDKYGIITVSNAGVVRFHRRPAQLHPIVDTDRYVAALAARNWRTEAGNI